MVNTLNGHKTDYEMPIFPITGNFKDENGVNNANLILVQVEKEDSNGNKTWETLTAVKGKAASKIGVDPNTDWADEYQDIDEKWNGQFSAWVKGERAYFYK